MVAIDTMSNTVIGRVAIGQAPQAVAYVPGAVPQGDGMAGLVPLGEAGETAHLTLAPPARGGPAATPPTSVSLFSQGLTQVLQAAVTGLAPQRPYLLVLSRQQGPGGMKRLMTASA